MTGKEVKKMIDDAIEKQIPKEVLITGHNNALGCDIGNCYCGNMVRSYMKYCDECGQRLDWR